MAGTIRFKKGSTLRLGCSARQADGVTPQSLVGWSIACDVRSGTQLVEALDVTVLDYLAGSFELESAGTATWPSKLLRADIKYTMPGGDVSHTETFFLDCVESETT